jgi:acyl dehydratase
MRAITPFRACDTVTFAGDVTDKRIDDGNRIVDCRERGELVCLSDATMMLPA